MKRIHTDEVSIMIGEIDKYMLLLYPKLIKFEGFIMIFTEANLK